MPTKLYFKKLNGKYVKDEEARTSIIEKTAERVKTFETVADMKEDELLTIGEHVRTKGYRAAGDSGAAFYSIVAAATAGEADDGRIHLLENGLKAVLIIENEVTPQMFGAYGDGVADDTSAIQKALNANSNVFIPDGTYMINAEASINANTGNMVKLSNNATLKAITNAADRYVIFKIDNVDNVEISGGVIQGDRLTHTGTTGEWGYGIQIVGTSDNIYIHDMQIKDTWGDGIGVTTTGDVITERVRVNNARRNGYSIICANRFISNDDLIENTNGTAPEFAVDIEPDSDTEILNYIVFNNLRTKGNAGGGISQHFIRNNSAPYHVEVNNLLSENDLRGIWFNSTGSDGLVIYREPVIKDSGSFGIYIKNATANTELRIEKPNVDGCFSTSTSPSSGISITSNANETAGNIYISEPKVINNLGSNANKIAIRFDPTTGCTYKDIILVDPIDLDELGIFFNSLSDNVQIIDGYAINKIDTDAAPLSLGGNPLCSMLETSSYTQLRQTWISNATKFPIGYKMRFLNNGSHGVKLYFQDQYIYGITNEIGKIVQSTDPGAYLEIMRISDNAWTVLSKSGTWTSN